VSLPAAGGVEVTREAVQERQRLLALRQVPPVSVTSVTWDL
jgi:hypothetical protein